MERRIHLYVSRRNVFVWLSMLAILASAVTRVIPACLFADYTPHLWGELVLPLMVACSSDDGDNGSGGGGGKGNTHVVVNENGTTSNGSIFSAIDDKNFYIDYIKYIVEKGHLVVVDYDETGLK